MSSSVFTRGPKFEPRAYLAYRVEGASGYRASAQARWRLLRLEPNEKRAHRLSRAISAVEGAPDFVIQPADEQGRLRVSSTVPIVVQEYGDPSPRVAGLEVEVSYGAVLRAGPTLIAPLYNEQARSLESGALSLPNVGESTSSPTIEEQKGELFRSVRRRRAVLRLVAVAVTLLFFAIAAGVVWKAMLPTMNPTRLLVVMRGWDDELCRELFDELDRRALRLGLTPGVVCEPASSPSSALSRYREMARQTGAGSLLVVDADVVLRRPEHNPREVFEVDRISIHLASETRRPPWSVEIGRRGFLSNRSVEEATGSRELRRRIAFRAFESLLPEVFSALFEQPDLAELASSVSTSYEDLDELILLRRAQKAVVRRREVQQEFGRALTENRGAEPVFTVLASGSSEAMPIGLSPDGQSFFVLERAMTDVFELSNESPGRHFTIPTLEQIIRFDADGRRLETLARTERYSGVPSSSADGRVIYAVESIDNGHALVAIETRGARRSIIDHWRGRLERFQIEASPRGQYVAILQQGRRGEESAKVRVFDSLGQQSELQLDRMRDCEWVEIVREEGEEPEILLALLIDGERESYFPSVQSILGRAAEEPARAEAPRRAEALEGAHVLLLTPQQLEVVERVDPADWDVVGLAGSSEGALLMTLADDEGIRCVIGRYDAVDDELVVLRTNRCRTDVATTTMGSQVLSYQWGRYTSMSGFSLVDSRTGEGRFLESGLGVFSATIASTARDVPVLLMRVTRPGSSLTMYRRGIYRIDLESFGANLPRQ